MRRFAFIALALVLTASIALAVGVAALTGHLPGLARPLVRQTLELGLGVPIELGAVEGSLLERFQLRDLRVGAGGDAAVHIDTLEVELDASTLLDRHVSVRKLAISGLDLGLMLEGGALHVIGLERSSSEDDAPPESGDAGWRFSLEHAALHRTRLGLTSAEETEVVALLDAEIDGSIWPPPQDGEGWPERASIVVQIESAESAGIVAQEGRLEIQARGPRVDLALHDFVLDGARLEGSLVARLDGPIDAPGIDTLRADIRGTAIDLSRFVGDARLDSSLNGHIIASLEGDTWQGRLQLEPSTLNGWPIERADCSGQVSGDGSRIRLDESTIIADGLRWSGAITLEDGAVQALEIAELAVDVEALPPDRRPEGVVRGLLRSSGRVAGRAPDLSGEISIDASGLELTFAQEPLRGDVRARVQLLGGERYRIEGLHVETFDRPAIVVDGAEPLELRCIGCVASKGGAPALVLERAIVRIFGGTLSVAGRVERGRLGGLEVAAEGLDVVAASRAGGAESAPPTGGRLSGALRFDGPFDAIRIDGEAHWTDPRIAQAEADEIELRLESSEAPASQSAVATLRRDRRDALVVHATVPTLGLFQDPPRMLTEPGLRANAVAEDVDVGWLSTQLPGEWKELRGRLDARIEVGGPLEAPEVDGEIEIGSPRRGDLHADRIALDFRSPGPDEPLRVDATLDGHGRTMLRATATLANRTHLASPSELLHDPDAQAVITADELDLAWLGSLSGSTLRRISGRLNGPIELRGGVDEPVVDGNLRLTDLVFEGPPLPRAVGPLSGRVRFDGSRAYIGPIKLPSGEGRAMLSGEVTLAEPYELDFALDLDRFELDQPGVLFGSVDGTFALVGRLDSLDASGKLTLRDAEIDMPDSQDPVMKEIHVLQLDSAEAPPSIFEGQNERDPLSLLQADLDFELGNNVWLRASGANLRLVGMLEVRKQRSAAPGLYGSVEVEEGTFDLNGRILKIRDGSAHFVGDPDPDPNIDVTAIHQVSDVVISVRIFGRASDLRVELQSDPPMSEQNMLSYLYFNRPLGDLDSDEQASVGMAASVLAAGAVLGPMGTQLGEMVGLSRVGVTVEEDQPAIELERRFGDRIRVLYSRSFGERGGDKVVVEYRLFRRLFVSGETRTTGESGVDVIWSHDY